MNTDEILMVLSQASKLHAKIDDAIERVLNYDTEINGKNADPVVDGEQGRFANGGKFSGTQMGVDGVKEARSLSSIRDALEILEDQLDCLQVLQQQQQADREAALLDLEESKRIFLERLRHHQGKEKEVVEEALAFVGEPVHENDNSHRTSHPRFSPENASFSHSDKEHPTYYEDMDHSLKNDAIKSLGWREDDQEEMVSGLENQTCKGVAPDVCIQNDQTESKGKLFRVLCHSIQRLQKPVCHAVSLAAKTALIVASVVTVMTLTNVGKNNLRKGNVHKAHSAPSAKAISSQPTGKNLHLLEECQPGKVTSHNDSIDGSLQECSFSLP